MRRSCDSSMYSWSSCGERLRGREIVPEGLLDHHPGVLGEPGAGETLDHGPEQERRDLQVEHRLLRTLDRRADATVGGVVAEVARRRS